MSSLSGTSPPPRKRTKHDLVRGNTGDDTGFSDEGSAILGTSDDRGGAGEGATVTTPKQSVGESGSTPATAPASARLQKAQEEVKNEQSLISDANAATAYVLAGLINDDDAKQCLRSVLSHKNIWGLIGYCSNMRTDLNGANKRLIEAFLDEGEKGDSMRLAVLQVPQQEQIKHLQLATRQHLLMEDMNRAQQEEPAPIKERERAWGNAIVWEPASTSSIHAVRQMMQQMSMAQAQQK